MARVSFKFHRSFRDAAECLKGEEKLRFIEAIIDLALNGKDPDFDNQKANELFAKIRPNIVGGYLNHANQELTTKKNQ